MSEIGTLSRLSRFVVALALPAMVGCMGSSQKPSSNTEVAKAVVVETAPASATAPAPATTPAPTAEAPAPAESPATPALAAEPVRDVGDQEFGPAQPKLNELYRIRTGDSVEIGIWGEDETRHVTVGPDGRISYLQATELMAAGLTLSELKAAIQEQLKEYYKRPVVYVSLLDSAGMFALVTGQVGRSGIYKITNETRVVDLLAQAGGIPLASAGAGLAATRNVADLERSYLLRGDHFEPVDFTKLMGDKSEVDPKAIVANNVRILPNDRIYIASAIKLENKIYVLGEVGGAGIYQFGKDITFLEAIALAGDMPESAWERKTFIIRGRLTNPQIIPVNAREVRTGKIPDFYLQAGDVVFVPKTPFTKMEQINREISGAIFGAIVNADRAYTVDKKYFKR